MLFEKIALEPDEKVLKIVQRHWFVIVSELVGVFITAIMPLVFISIFLSIDHVSTLIPFSSEHVWSFASFFIAIWLLLSLMTGFMIWTHYYLDSWVITDRRIINIEQTHFFNRNVAIFRLERLQDIEYHIKGLIPTFLNFGVLSAQTAGHTEHNFRSDGMPDPRELQALIQSAMDARLRALHITPNETE
jgi:L-cystine uptake protein TcyP (sodium:dicarboxylate symporter family)